MPRSDGHSTPGKVSHITNRLLIGPLQSKAPHEYVASFVFFKSGWELELYIWKYFHNFNMQLWVYKMQFVVLQIASCFYFEGYLFWQTVVAWSVFSLITHSVEIGGNATTAEPFTHRKAQRERKRNHFDVKLLQSQKNDQVIVKEYLYCYSIAVPRKLFQLLLCNHECERCVLL